MSAELRSQVFWKVAQAGALTTRRIIQEFGPKPNWQALLSGRTYLREYQTPYGAVLALAPQGRALAQQHQQRVPYLAGPSAVTDRAYQQDALTLLQHQGYEVARYIYKKAGKVGGAARRGERGHRKHRLPGRLLDRTFKPV